MKRVKQEKERKNLIKLVPRIIWWIGGAIPSVLINYPTEYGKYYGIGGAIIFTTILATISSYVALSIVTNSYLVRVLAAIFWGLMIFNLDRFITISMKKRGNELVFYTRSEKFWHILKEVLPAVPRFIIAIIIGLLISIPLELKIFSIEVDGEVNHIRVQEYQRLISSINKLIEEDVIKTNKVNSIYDTNLKKIEKKHSNNFGETQQKLNIIQKQIDSINNKKNILSTKYLDEVQGKRKKGSGVRGVGRIARQIKKESNAMADRYQDELLSLTRKRKEILKLFHKEEQLFFQEKEQIIISRKHLRDSHQRTISHYEASREKDNTKLASGLLFKIKALFQLGESDATIKWSLRLFIIMIFLIESSPILVKLMSPRGAYEAKIEEIDFVAMYESDKIIEELKREARKEQNDELS